MTDHPRLTRYTPYVNGAAFMGMLRQNAMHPETFGPDFDWTHGPYVLASEADAEIERLRGEIERLTKADAAAERAPDIADLLSRMRLSISHFESHHHTSTWVSNELMKEAVAAIEMLSAEIERLTHPAGAPADDTML